MHHLNGNVSRRVWMQLVLGKNTTLPVASAFKFLCLCAISFLFLGALRMTLLPREDAAVGLE